MVVRWYKGEKHKSRPRMVAQVPRNAIEGMQESPISREDNLKVEGRIDLGLMQIVYREVLKALKSKGMMSFDFRSS